LDFGGVFLLVPDVRLKEGFVRKLFFLVLLSAVGGGWWFFQRYQIEGIDHFALKPRQPTTHGASAADDSGAGVQLPVERQSSTIRIASFDVQKFDTAKLGKPQVMKVLADVMRRFDVVAIQEICTPRDDLMPRFIEQVNATGRHYDYVVGPRQGRGSDMEQYAFVFDAASVEVDRSAVYTVNDPSKLFRHDPLAASFRVRGPPAGEAFTFTLVDVHVDPEQSSDQMDALGEVYRAVRNDGRDEDDIILLGNLNSDDRHLGLLGQAPNITSALSNMPTNTRGTKMYDNILLHRTATTEFMGRAGVLDLLHEFNLTMSEALEVSDHLPIWAEFSIYEGGQPGRVATRPPAPK
jgi:deoxyribonuclease-1-like protein